MTTLKEYAVVLACPKFPKLYGLVARVISLPLPLLQFDGVDNWIYARDAIAMRIPSSGHADFVLEHFHKNPAGWIDEHKTLVVGYRE